MRRELRARTGAFLWVTAPPRTIEPLLEALLELFRAFEETPAKMWISSTDAKRSAYKYNEARLVRGVRDNGTISVGVKGAGEAQVDVHLDLRYDPRYEPRIPRDRLVELVAPPVPPDDPRLLAFLEVACAAYPVAHGGVMQGATCYYASAEGSLVGAGMIDSDAQKRITFDASIRQRAANLRRLYPVTIIGPDIWATLPPLPAVEPPLVVRDLADCKMVTAWPTLVDPHDLQFLLGTRELRRWLWPHTIQNPADDPHEVDVRLKWAELLPW